MPNRSGTGAGANGGSGWNRATGMARAHNPFLIILLALGCMVQGLSMSDSQAQDTPETPDSPAHMIELLETANRDSLMLEIRAYSEMIRGLRDSLSVDESGLQLSAAQREKLEGNIADISGVIEQISSELGRMEFEIKDNRISLVNEAGEGIIINVPEDLDEQVSSGIEAITQMILSEMPDSIDFDHSKKWDWGEFRPKPPASPRRVINGNIVKVWNDVHISAKEDVRGNVVVIFGDVEVSGRVDGSVVTVFGNLALDKTAEVTGSVVAAGGYLDQDPEAIVDNVVAVDPLQRGRGEGFLGLFDHDWMSFLVCQGLFLLTVLMALIAVATTPRQRLENLVGALRSGVMPCLGTGTLAALVGHLVVVVLMAVLVLTVIGVPLALLVGMALLMVVVVAVAICGAVVGEKLCALFGDRCHSPWLVVVVGMIALHAFSFLGSLMGLLGVSGPLASFVVVLGLVVKTIAYLLGLGALVLSRFGSKTASA